MNKYSHYKVHSPPDLPAAGKQKTGVSLLLSGKELLAKRVGTKELAVISHQLATMIQAGLPLLQCLNVLIRQSENKTLRKTLQQVSENLTEGMSFGEALNLHPKVFPAVFIDMVKSGEISGTLEQVFSQLGVNLQKEYELAAKIKSAILYPVAVVVIALISVFVLLFFVVPQFVMILSSMTLPLPFTTRLLIGASNILLNYWYIILFCGIIATLCCLQWLRSENGRQITDKLILKIPILGKFAHKIIIARFCRSLSALLHAGVPILQALEVVRRITGNYTVMQSIAAAEESILRGDGLALPLQRSGLFPPLVVKMIAVGEETGAMDKLLEQVAVFYENEVEELATRLSALIEPLLITAVGGIVAFVILSIILPMFSIMNTIE